MSTSQFVSSAQQHYSMLSDWNLSKVREYLVEKEKYDESTALAMEIEYKRFLALTLALDTKMNVPVSAEVDPFWHTHIIFTHDYTNMCHALGGVYVHHVPAVTEEERGRLCDSYRESTLTLYKAAVVSG